MPLKIKKKCSECDKKLVKDEIALSRKLVGDVAEDMFCVSCLAEYIGCSEEDLRIKIQEFKEHGCGLFF